MNPNSISARHYILQCGVLPLLIFVLNNLMGWWTDTISIGLWLCDRARGSAEKCLALQLCFLVPTLGCHLIDWVIFLDKRDAPSQVGWTPSPLTRPGFLQKASYANYLQSPHHLQDTTRQRAVKRQHAAEHVITCCVRERARENYCVWHRFCKSTHRLNINFSDLRHAKPGVVAADVTYDLYDLTVFTFSFSQQLQFTFDVAGSGPWNAIDYGRWCR